MDTTNYHFLCGKYSIGYLYRAVAAVDAVFYAESPELSYCEWPVL